MTMWQSASSFAQQKHLVSFSGKLQLSKAQQFQYMWRKIEDGSEYIQSLQAIPWPPFSAGMIAALAEHDTMMDQQLSPAKRTDNISGLSWRKAYRKALLRWHPDKISARLVSVQHVAHRESALQRTHQILDSIHNEWAQHTQQS
ncbi:MAG: hypothetical protein FRX49_05891 [Trebouxia sp. A1-2]|nr:MAG: hypothetical protein FRX49_05891 [Trebouxia sp. A1-2]